MLSNFVLVNNITDQCCSCHVVYLNHQKDAATLTGISKGNIMDTLWHFKWERYPQSPPLDELEKNKLRCINNKASNNRYTLINNCDELCEICKFV